MKQLYKAWNFEALSELFISGRENLLNLVNNLSAAAIENRTVLIACTDGDTLCPAIAFLVLLDIAKKSVFIICLLPAIWAVLINLFLDC